MDYSEKEELRQLIFDIFFTDNGGLNPVALTDVLQSGVEQLRRIAVSLESIDRGPVLVKKQEV